MITGNSHDSSDRGNERGKKLDNSLADRYEDSEMFAK